MPAFIEGLVCRECGALQSDMERQFRCTGCNGFLEARYDMAAIRRHLDRSTLAARRGGVWRFREVLPVRDDANIVSLKEGGTPLLRSRRIGRALGMANLYFKDLTRNPTYSFKDYSSTVSISKAKEIGVPALAVMSAGNGASSVSAYCAAAGIPFHAMMLPNAYEGMITQCMVYGANGYMLDGIGADVWPPVSKLIQERGWMDSGVPINPYRAEGKKIIGYEICEDLDWQAPDRIVCPTAGGASILGLTKAFSELKALAWIDGGAKLDCVQAESCAPVVEAWRSGGPIKPAQNPNSIAIGLLAANPGAGRYLVDAIRGSGGAGVTVNDQEIKAAQLSLAKDEALYVEPSSAAALAGLKRLREAGVVGDDERVVLLLTGAGIKASEIASSYVPRPVPFAVRGAT
ncbi:MAG: threonine synthase [Alphaproteobacteria bacterium]|nr:threonine synthase [Alphaproteobacteria bacterium]